MEKKSRLIRIIVSLLLVLVINHANAQVAANSSQSEFAKLLGDANFLLISFAIAILLFAVFALSKTAIRLLAMISNKGKRNISIALLLLCCHGLFAQQADTNRPHPEPPAWLMDANALLLFFIFLILLITIYVLYKVNMRLMGHLMPHTVSKSEPVVAAQTVAAPGFWRRIYLSMVDSVPVAKEKDILLDHDYDGIKELDNNLPPWWKYGFYLTIVFGICYLFIYHVSGIGKLQAAEYNTEVAFARIEKENRLKAAGDNVNEENVTRLTDKETLGKGKETYDKLCVSCHLITGAGLVGPNLTDKYWIHGGGIKNIFKIITYGVPNKGMISWSSQLTPKQIQAVSSYVMTLEGTNPAGAKEPQGELYTEPSTATPVTTATQQDSSAVASAPSVQNK